MLLCDYCDDAYHLACLKPKHRESANLAKEDAPWYCPICLDPKTRPNDVGLENKYLARNQCMYCRKKCASGFVLQQHSKSSSGCVRARLACQGAAWDVAGAGTASATATASAAAAAAAGDAGGGKGRKN